MQSKKVRTNRNTTERTKWQSNPRQRRANLRPKRKKAKYAIMCWEPTSNFSEEEPQEEPEKVAKKPVEKTEKQKHGEEHVGPTPDTSSQIKILIEEFSWEREDDESTLETEEPEQQEIVYITNLEDGLRKNDTKLYNEESLNEKSLLREIGLLKSPP